MFICPNCGYMQLVMARERPGEHYDMFYPFRCGGCNNYGMREPTERELQLSEQVLIVEGAHEALQYEITRWYPGRHVPAEEEEPQPRGG